MKRLVLLLIVFSPLLSISQQSKGFPLPESSSYTPPAGVDLTTGLIAAWKFDEVSGSATDSHGSHTGTVTGITQNVSGKDNTCYEFDRLSSVPDATTGVVIGTSTDFNIASTTGSISVWINSTLELYWAGAIASTHNADVGNSGYQLWLQADGSGDHHIACTLGAAGSEQTVIGTTVIDNSGSTWYHIVMTWNAAGNIIAYVNGVEEINTAVTLTPVDAYDFNIGRTPSEYAPMWFDGKIDEVYPYNIVLSPTQVSALHLAGAGTFYPF